jgi:uncharacterized protein (TIGR02001 family)
MKFIYKSIIAGALLTNIVQAAELGSFDITGNMTLTSDYVFRGKSQTNDGFAIQGGLDFAHKNSNFIFGTWASNVKFLEDQTVIPNDRADIEVDFYVGYGDNLDQLADGLSYSAKLNRYTYPGAASSLSYDMTEYSLSLSYTTKQDTDFGLEQLPYLISQGVSFNLLYDFSPDFSGMGKSHHYGLNVNYTFANGLGVGGEIGQQLFADNNKAGDDYLYYGAKLSYPIAGFDASVAYTGTDLNNAEQVDADDRVIFALSKDF